MSWRDTIFRPQRAEPTPDAKFEDLPVLIQAPAPASASGVPDDEPEEATKPKKTRPVLTPPSTACSG